jgi:hypothetical protein
MGKKRSLEQMVQEQQDVHMWRNESGHPISYHVTKIKSNWMNHIKICAKTIKLLEEGIALNLHDLQLAMYSEKWYQEHDKEMKNWKNRLPNN